MRRARLGPAALGIGLSLLLGCGGEEVPATTGSGGMAVDLPDIPRNTAIDSVMANLVDEAAHGLWAIAHAGMAPPESTTSWEDVEQYAIQLIASGDYMTYRGVGQLDATGAAWPEGWRLHAQDLADAGLTALDAAISRDVNGVLAAGDKLVTVCESCHQELGLASPTEGTIDPNR